MKVSICSVDARGGRLPSAKPVVEQLLRDMRPRVDSPLAAWKRVAKDHPLQRDLIIDEDFDGGFEHDFASLPTRRRAELAS